VPGADLSIRSIEALFDHFVGAGEQRRWHVSRSELAVLREPAGVGFVNTAMVSLADGFYRVAVLDHSGIDAYPRGSCEGTIVI
jgi:hypothetical protein